MKVSSQDLAVNALSCPGTLDLNNTVGVQHLSSFCPKIFLPDSSATEWREGNRESLLRSLRFLLFKTTLESTWRQAKQLPKSLLSDSNFAFVF